MKSKGLAALKARIELAPINVRGRRRCPKELREEIIRYANRCRREGTSIDQIADALGLRSATLSKWLRESKKRAKHGKIKSVEVSDRTGRARSAPLRSDGVSLVLSSGHRVEGLDIEQLAKLVRALP